MNDRRTYGDAVMYSHHMDGSPPLIARSLPRSQIGVTRISCGPEHIVQKDLPVFGPDPEGKSGLQVRPARAHSLPDASEKE